MNHLRAPVVRYGFAAAMVTLATVASLQGKTLISPLPAPHFYVLAVLFSAVAGGFAPGVVALLLSLVVGGLCIGLSYASVGAVLIQGLVFLLLSLSILYIVIINCSLRERADSALKALTRRELELRATLEALPVGIWFTDKEGRIISGNKAAKKIWGGIRYIGPKEYGAYKIFNPRTHQPLEPGSYPISQALSGSEVQNQEVEIETFDNIRRKLLVSAVPLRSAGDGEIWGVVAINEDITTRESALEGLRRAKEDAERANRAKDRFLAVLSHELRTPLTPVLMLAESLEKDPNLPESLRADARMMRRYVLLEARLIDDLLDLTRIEKGKLLLHRQTVNLNTVLRSVMKMVQPQAQHKGLRLSTRLTAQRYFVEADRARIKQVIWNILGNAIKFTPTGGGIVLTTEDVGNEIQITVKDTGIGVPSDALKTIFAAFEQANVEHRRFGGLGLGLAIAKSLTELHGGHILAHSRGCGQGAVFTITLPASMKLSPEPPSPSKIPATDTGRLRILIVEDHEPTASILTKLLKRRGNLVYMASSVGEALALDGQSIDLLVSDIGLPDGSGLDVVRHYRPLNANLKAIALSGFGMDNDVERSLLAGFDRHLTKPVDFETLQGVIMELLQGAVI